MTGPGQPSAEPDSDDSYPAHWLSPAQQRALDESRAAEHPDRGYPDSWISPAQKQAADRAS